MKNIWKSLRQEDIQVKILAGFLLGILILILLPLFIVGLYSVKSVDDFIYFAEPQAYWQSTHSLWGLLQRQAGYAYDIWKNWQGVYFQEWYKTVLMGICGDKYYFVGSWLSIGSAAGFGFLLVWSILRRILGADRSRTLIISVSCVSMQMLLVQMPQEAFYWFTGSVHYTVTYGLNLLLITILLYEITAKQLSRLCLAGLETAVVFLSLAVGGGNFTSGVFTLSLYGIAVLLLWLYKHPRKWLISINLAIYLPAFLLCVLAPGNWQRLQSAGATQNAVWISILKSFREAAAYIVTWTNLPLMIVGILLVPIIWKIVGLKGYSYKCPAIVSLLSFCVFASQFMPTLYTLGISGVGRIYNLYRFTMIFWLYGNEIYWIGWVKKRMEISEESGNNNGKNSFLLWLWGADF